MKSGKKKWIFLLIMGISPFLIAVICCLVTASLHYAYLDLSRIFDDFFGYLVFYSFLYWPTYLIGMVLILLSIIMIRRKC